MPDLRELLGQFGYLADSALFPERWAALDRVRRLYTCRFREPALLARPPLVVVLGGTNVGKSTVFNLLLREQVARICPTPVGTKSVALSVRRDAAAAFWDETFLPGWEKLAYAGPDALNEPFDGTTPRLYLHERDDGPALALADTPDIDSVRRFNEREAEDLFYLADALLFVSSEQKYADEACVQYLRRAARFGKSVVAVLSRSTADSEAFADFAQSKLPQAGVTEPAAVLALPWLNTDEIVSGAVPDPPAVAALHAELAALAARGRELRRRAARGAAAGLVAELEQALAPLEAEQAGVTAWLARCTRAVSDTVASYEPHLLDPDDLDQAVLEALSELRVPGIDWVYEQLGVASRRLRFGARLMGTRLSNLLGRPLRTLDEVDTDRHERERDQVRRLLTTLLSDQRSVTQACPLELREPLRSRLPDLAGHALEQTLDAWQATVERERRTIIADAKAKIVGELQAKGTAIKGFKLVTRTASVALSVVVALHTGQVGLHDFAVAPLADAVTKLVLDKVMGDTWRRQLQGEVDQRRRTCLDAWLRSQTLQPVLDGLPAAHGEPFAAQARAAAAVLLAASSSEGTHG